MSILQHPPGRSRPTMPGTRSDPFPGDSGAPFVLFRDDLTGNDILFAEPREIISADTAEEFEAALQRAEAIRRDGRWLAGYFAYEAGYLLEPKLRPLLPKGRRGPLLRLGVFDAPADRVAEAKSAQPTN